MLFRSVIDWFGFGFWKYNISTVSSVNVRPVNKFALKRERLTLSMAKIEMYELL